MDAATMDAAPFKAVKSSEQRAGAAFRQLRPTRPPSG